MAVKWVIVEMRIPKEHLDDDDILDFAYQELYVVTGFELDRDEPPNILHCLKEKTDNVVLVFGTIEEGKEDGLKKHPLVLGIDTDPAHYSFFASNKS